MYLNVYDILYLLSFEESGPLRHFELYVVHTAKLYAHWALSVCHIIKCNK